MTHHRIDQFFKKKYQQIAGKKHEEINQIQSKIAELICGQHATRHDFD